MVVKFFLDGVKSKTEGNIRTTKFESNKSRCQIHKSDLVHEY